MFKKRPAVSGDRGLQSQPVGEPECEEKWPNGTAEHRVSVGEGGSFEQGRSRKVCELEVESYHLTSPTS